LVPAEGAKGALYDAGPLSMYYPGDGWNAGELACGGRFTQDQVHIAYRKWRKVGCGRRVLVCARDTSRCVMATVQDAGPFGIYTGPLKNAYREGRWKVFTGPGRPPKGWRYRAVVDLSVGLWRKLGRPRGLSHVSLLFLPRRERIRRRPTRPSIVSVVAERIGLLAAWFRRPAPQVL
jgi:hypothetical protein